MNKPFLIIGLAVASLSAANASTILLSEHFDSENGGNPTLSATSLTQWSISGNFDLIGTGASTSSYDFYPGHGLYIDTDGTGSVNGGSNATITSNAIFGPGSYTLEFLLGINPNGNTQQLKVSLGDFTQTFNPTAGPLTPVNLSFTTTSSGSLSFQELGSPDQQGSILDDITLSTPTIGGQSQVPEPATMALSALSLLALGVGGRRLRSNPSSK